MSGEISPEGDGATPTPRGRAMRIFLAVLPLVLFVALAGAFLAQLMSGRDASEIPSALLGQPAPALSLTGLDGLRRDGSPVPALDTAALAGQLTLVNVWASWCVPCRQEHPLLMDLARQGDVRVVGINYKDNGENALRFLGELGNPYDAVGVDPDGRTAIDWGVYGIPESFLVDAEGRIVYKKVGPFSPESFRDELLPAIAAAR
jgi:cytochrome c biogenesis protein CcmG, thiol:disulfide interchange protein DsbE